MSMRKDQDSSTDPAQDIEKDSATPAERIAALEAQVKYLTDSLYERFPNHPKFDADAGE